MYRKSQLVYRLASPHLWAAILSLTLVLRASAAATADQVSSTVASTPPMGWNSWDCFGMEVTEDQVKATADYMARHMKHVGWEYVVVDMGWYYDEGVNTNNFMVVKKPPQFIDTYGRLIPSLRKFPSAANGKGLKPLADYVHSLGLKFGIHILRGIPWQAVEQNTPIEGSTSRARDIVDASAQCPWYDGLRGIDHSKPGAQAYYDSLIELYSEWGVDFIKADDMANKPYRREDVEAVKNALQRASRPIVLSLSPGEALIEEREHLQKNANMWRISGDMWDDWSYVKHTFELCRAWQDFVEPGHWPDCDMIPIGRLRINGTDGALAKQINVPKEATFNQFSRLKPNEQYSLLTLWYIFRSPLIMGGNLLEYDEDTLRMFTNEEALTVSRQSTRSRELRANEREIIWTALDSVTGQRYVAIFNIADDGPSKISLKWSELGLSGSRLVRDLWERKDIGSLKDGLDIVLAPHSVALYRIK